MEKGKVDIELIKRYIRGELSPREMYALERRAQEDSAWMDVILGMEGEVQPVHEANLKAIRERMMARTGRGRLRRLAPAQRWAVAATVLVTFTLGTLWFTQWPTEGESQREIASASTGANESRVEKQASSKESSSETEVKDTAAEPAPQSSAPVKKRAEATNRKRLAAVPTEETSEVPLLAERMAMQTELKQKQPRDTLGDATVLGYGTQKKRDLTGAIDTVQLNEQALAGRAPGLQIRDGRMKATTDTPVPIRIRGVSRYEKSDIIKGKVVDAETQTPLSGVTVQLSENRTVTTDSAGMFTVTGPSTMLNAALLGYELQTIKIVENDSIIVVMEPTMAALNEVVVVGYGTKTSRPEPLDGWRAYRRYLKKGTDQPGGLTGDVTLIFTIDDEGSPTDIQIKQTTQPALTERAIELVRDGPKWKPGKNGERKVELQVKF